MAAALVTIRLGLDGVILRPMRMDELDRLFEVARHRPAEEDVHPVAEPPDRDRLRERIAASGSWSDAPAGLVLAIESEGRLVGEVQARGGRSQVLPRGVFELGIELYESRDRGRGLGSAAIAAITRHLFEDEDAHRVQVSTDVDNGGMRGAAERAGFRREGVLRGFFTTARGPRDYVMYGMTYEDYEERKATWT